jgi:hypothetical protein
MFIGVLKVPFRFLGEEDAVWIDVQCDLPNISNYMETIHVFSDLNVFISPKIDWISIFQSVIL